MMERGGQKDDKSIFIGKIFPGWPGVILWTNLSAEFLLRPLSYWLRVCDKLNDYKKKNLIWYTHGTNNINNLQANKQPWYNGKES
jgi:hypothetical protein